MQRQERPANRHPRGIPQPPCPTRSLRAPKYPKGSFLWASGPGAPYPPLSPLKPAPASLTTKSPHPSVLRTSLPLPSTHSANSPLVPVSLTTQGTEPRDSQGIQGGSPAEGHRKGAELAHPTLAGR